MLKVPLLIICALVVVLVVATIFKQHQRKILWSAAIALFVGTLLLVGIGVINPVGETHPNLPALTGIIMALVSAAALACTAEKLHSRNRFRKALYMSKPLTKRNGLSCRSVSIPSLPARSSHER